MMSDLIERLDNCDPWDDPDGCVEPIESAIADLREQEIIIRDHVAYTESTEFIKHIFLEILHKRITELEAQIAHLRSTLAESVSLVADQHAKIEDMTDDS